MMHRARRRVSENRQILSPTYPDPSSDESPNKVSDQARTVSPDPFRHAEALVESFGARTALQIAQFNSQLTGPNGSYWADVLDSVVDAWGQRSEIRPALRVQ
jgi:hypothetical protein